jgi:hypothetical protein
MSAFKPLHKPGQAKPQVKSWGPADAVDEETHLTKDIGELDRDHPGWDRRSKVLAARRLLKEPGMEEAVVRGIYGKAIVEEALAAEGLPAGGLASS